MVSVRHNIYSAGQIVQKTRIWTILTTTTSKLEGLSYTVKIALVPSCPHEQQQSLLLSRIITNIEKLNEAVAMMNRNLQEVNIQNMNVELVAQMFKNYQSNVLFHLEATNNLKDPV
ncbi:hypothetical protein PV10_04956 [Exophiala mesophila]|uniref:DASH complex subunit DAD4 n=1 Tax=Exophiala mesophila TaxID=212818 RepID=A0A0D1WWJ0_EXOME|nr:uncharacterized protein PV10_04956 [Exophiala mesophila]KIV93765.1 hypothetical protein PV10_04956 [Exophiala mesophila]